MVYSCSMVLQQEEYSCSMVLQAMPSLHMEHPGDDEPGVCAGCGAPITERYYLLAVDKQWHADCLKCSSCHLNLDAQLTCFAKDGEIFCKEDYYRRFAVKACSRCQMGISAQELVMRARNCVYHLHCFSCAACNKLLNTGDHFGMKDNLIFCKLHYEPDSPERDTPVTAPEFLSPPPSALYGGEPGRGCVGVGGGGGGGGGMFPELYPPGGLHAEPSPPHLPFYNGVGALQKGRPRKPRKSPLPPECDQQTMHGLGLEPHDPGNPHDPFYQYSRDMAKQKRMRTSFKHHQLRAMRAYFSINHNPDAKDLKQLSEKTGLPKKVLQVWFQNARAKYRRNLLKQEGGGGGGDKNHSPKAGEEAGKLPDMPRSPSGLSDMSSSTSMSDLHTTSSMDSAPAHPSLSDLFAQSIHTMS